MLPWRADQSAAPILEGNGFVKAVPSGDTVVIIGQRNNGPPPEIQLTLASLLSPRPPRGPDREVEPWGWQAREYLRNLLVGKSVRFCVDYKVRVRSVGLGREGVASQHPT